MAKMAIFVEGMTELVFMQRLVEEIAGRLDVSIDTVEAWGGSPGNPRVFKQLTAHGHDGIYHYVLLYNSSTDSRVASDIIDNYRGLISQGFTRIIGLRDVYPLPSSSIARIQTALAPRLPTAPVLAKVLFAIREIEAWFLADYTHFQRIDPDLTHDVVTAILGEDVRTLSVETVPHPSDLLDQIYKICNRRYKKTRTHVQRTVASLSLDHLYLEAVSRVPSLQNLCSEIDAFLTVTN